MRPDKTLPARRAALAAAAIAAVLGLSACATEAPEAAAPAAEAAPAPDTRTEAAIARRQNEIAELRPRAADDPAAARRIRRLEREIEQIKINAASGETGRAAPQFGVRF